MKCEYFSIENQYEIKCKIFVPDDNCIDGIIVGVHGFAGDKESSMLEKLAEAVCLSKWAVLSFDFPAHGDSPVDEQMLTADNCKSDLCAIVEYVFNKYPNSKISIFATSYGGYITLLCSDKLSNIPLVLRAPAVTMPKVLLENVLKIRADEFQKRNFVKCGFERKINLPYSFYENLMAQDVIESKKILSPTLIIHGDCDDIVPLSDVESFADSQSKVSIEIIRGADHRFKNDGEMETIATLTKSFLGI